MSNIDLRECAVGNLLGTFPLASLGEGTRETPKRVARMWEELLSGYGKNPEEILSKQFNVGEAGVSGENGSGIVVVKDIQFYSCCEHHLVPFFGHAHIAYLPRDKVVGLSKFARLVECYARRLQVQERMTQQIMKSVEECLEPRGAMVVVEAEHLCMTMRGVQKPGTKTVTSRVSGVFADSAKARHEVLELLKV